MIQRAVALMLIQGLLLISCASIVHALESQKPSTQRLTTESNRPKISRSVSLMTTRVDFILFGTHPATANAAIDQAIAEFHRIEALMSEWQPGSEVSRINQQAGQHPVAISPELFRLLQAAQRVSILSHGAFDISFRSAGKLWDFRQATVPTQEHIQRATRHIDYQRLTLTPEQGHHAPTAFITHPKTSIGLGAIAKGYAIDRAAQIFRQAGFDAFAINAGGDLYVAGNAQDRLWNVGIQHPRAPERLLASLPSNNLAIATSGDYERFFIHDGQRFSHIINPHTGYPANGCQSVTIIATRAFWADALATAVFVLGPNEGMALVETLDGVEALVVDQSGAVTLSRGFEQSSGYQTTE